MALREDLERIRLIVERLARATRVATTGYVGNQEMLDLENL